MMNRDKARQLATEATLLAEFVAEFQATYGRNYRLGVGSPDDAWTLDEAIRRQLVAIAGLLDEEALANPFTKWGEWWERYDVIDNAMVNEIVMRVYELIRACAFKQETYQTQLVQSAIAGLLPPHVRQLGLAEIA